MALLVTGTAGFIGMHVAERLLQEGHSVIGADSMNPYYDTRLKAARHAHLSQHEAFTPLRLDLAEPDQVEELFAEHRFETVCHLAAQPGVRYSFQEPAAYFRNNSQAFFHILEACRRYKVRRLVYASSSSVYGGNTKVPFAEDDPVERPLNLYAATKRENELLASVYAANHALKCVGLRFFTVYGPWGRPDMALWLFTEAIVEGRPIKVFNHGNMERDFTYVDDIASGVVSCLFGDLPEYSLMNLGNNRPVSLMALIEAIEKAVGREAKKEFLPMQPGEMLRTCANVSLAQEALGFQPATSLEEGVPRFVEWYMAWRERR